MSSMFTCCQQSRPGYCGENSLFSFKSNIKNYWSARYSCGPNIRNYMSYVNYAATNQIPVSLCIFIDVIILKVVFLHSRPIIPHMTAIIERSTQEEDKNGGLSHKKLHYIRKLILFLYYLKWFKSDIFLLVAFGISL